MQRRPSYAHVFDLITQLREASIDNQYRALEHEDGGFGLCLGAALATDAADALEALLQERPANDLHRSAQIVRRVAQGSFAAPN